MLDTLREALVKWAGERGDANDKERARGAAEKIGRAARTLLAGFTLRAKVPLAVASVEATFEPGKAMEAYSAKEAAEEPSSFYTPASTP